MSSGWAQTKIVLDGFFDLLACGKCKKTPERPVRYVVCGHFFCDTCVQGETNCCQCKIPVRLNEIQPYRTVAQLIEYCRIIKDVMAEIKPEDLKPLAKVVHKLAAERNGVVPETDSESDEDDEVVESTPPSRRGGERKTPMCGALARRVPGESSELWVKKDSEEPETAGYVDPTQFSQNQRKKDAEQETAGFVDPTQLTQRQGKKDLEPETAGFVEPTQLSQNRGKKEADPETIGYVDPTQIIKSPGERVLEPETAGYLDRTLTPPSRKKKTLRRKTLRLTTSTSQREENSRPESCGSYVDPTQPPNVAEKIDLEPETAGYVDPTQESPRVDEKYVKARKAESVGSSTIVRPGLESDLPPETVGYVDPTQTSPRPSEKALLTRNRVNSQPKTVGYVDPTQTSENTRSTGSPEFADSTTIDRVPEESDLRVKKSHTRWYEAMDSSEQPDGARENSQAGRASGDLVLAPESIEIEQTASARVVVPETLRDLEKPACDRDSPMEIDNSITEKSSPMKLDRGNDRETTTISDPGGNTSPESTETREETPLKQLRRIKSLALIRRGKITKKSHDRDSSPENRQKSPEKRLKIVENDLTADENIPSIRHDSRVVTAGVENLEPEEFVAETTTREPRRGRKWSSGEKKISTIDKSTLRETPDVGAEEPLPQLKSVENLEIEDRVKGSGKKCKEKLVKLKSRRSIDKSKNPAPKTIPRNVNKRNAKGETPLHTACVKGQDDYVKALLEAGANPNTKDNANWTPLQEAVNLGHREICKMLLQAGASANTPAMENRTALHDAAASGKLEEAALLLRFNANKNVYDKFGKRPIDYAVSDEMRALLADENEIEKNIDDVSCLDSTLDQSIIVPNAKVIVLPSNLSNKNRKLLSQLASKLKVEIATSFRPTVTHVVVETNERNNTKLTYYVMLAILQGKWILNSQWITIGTDLNDISEIDLELFEVHGAPNPETPTRARINEEKQNPRLFNNCFFYFAIGARCTWSYEKFEFTKESLTTLVLAGQGEILHREPDPEDVKDCQLTPFHVAHKPLHPLHRCSHYIIYMPGKDEPRVKYNMPHIKSLPVGWFLECIEKFSLVDPLLMGIS